MPDVNTVFDYSTADIVALNARYATLMAKLKKLPSGMPDPNAIHDDATLHEMCNILAQLRRRNSGPPKTPKGREAKTPRQKTPVPETSLDQL